MLVIDFKDTLICGEGSLSLYSLDFRNLSFHFVTCLRPEGVCKEHQHDFVT